jgi:hypothetical protein
VHIDTWPMKQFLAGLRRELGTAPERKRPLLAEDLREILLDLPDSKLGKRPGAAVAGFHRRLPPLRVGRFGRQRPRRSPRRTHLDHSEIQNRPGRAVKTGRHSAGCRRGQLSALGSRRLARRGRDRNGGDISGHEPPRSGFAQTPFRRRRGNRR